MAGVAKDQASSHVHVIFIRLQLNGARFNANFTVIKGNYPFADEKVYPFSLAELYGCSLPD